MFLAVNFFWTFYQLYSLVENMYIDYVDTNCFIQFWKKKISIDPRRWRIPYLYLTCTLPGT